MLDDGQTPAYIKMSLEYYRLTEEERSFLDAIIYDDEIMKRNTEALETAKREQRLKKRGRVISERIQHSRDHYRMIWSFGRDVHRKVN